MGCLRVVTFGNVGLSLFRGKPTRPTCRLWRLAIIDGMWEKTRLQSAVEKYKFLEKKKYSQAAKV